MPRIKNVSPLGELEVPLLRPALFKAGDVRDVSVDHARRLLPQFSNYAPADAEAEAILADIVAEAEAAELAEAAALAAVVDEVVQLPVALDDEEGASE